MLLNWILETTRQSVHLDLQTDALYMATTWSYPIKHYTDEYLQLVQLHLLGILGRNE